MSVNKQVYVNLGYDWSGGPKKSCAVWRNNRPLMWKRNYGEVLEFLYRYQLYWNNYTYINLNGVKVKVKKYA